MGNPSASSSSLLLEIRRMLLKRAVALHWRAMLLRRVCVGMLLLLLLLLWRSWSSLVLLLLRLLHRGVGFCVAVRGWVQQHGPEPDRVAEDALHSLVAPRKGESLHDRPDAVDRAEAQQVEREPGGSSCRAHDAFLAQQQLRRRDHLLLEAHAKHDQLAVRSQ